MTFIFYLEKHQAFKLGFKYNESFSFVGTKTAKLIPKISTSLEIVLSKHKLELSAKL